jgi:hypothetical protein
MANLLEKYQKIVVDILEYYAQLPSMGNANAEFEEQLIIDKEHNHYQILAIGWEDSKRVYYPVFHIDIKNEKIWVQEDATDFDFVGELEKRGVPASDIVLAFHAPYKRQYTAYAVA